MADFEEKKYSIDPGPGKKMDGCPYSNYEDGHDIQDYIIPPKGYVFSGFRFDPDAKNQIYDGKLYAQYTKEPFKNRLKSNLWKVMLAVIIVAVIALIVLLASGIFKEPKTRNNTSNEPKTEVTTNPSKELKKTDNSLSKTTKRNKQSRKERKEKERKERKERKEKEKQEKLAKKEAEKAKKEAEKAKKESKKDNKETAANIQQEPVAKPQEQVEQPQEPAKPAVIDPNEQFKQEFWDLVQQRNPSMDAYTDLYNKYKSDVKGEEFDYLRFTILKDYVTFKAWYDNLRAIPVTQLQSIKSVDALKNKINL